VRTYLGIPAHDGRICIETQMSLAQCKDLYVDQISIKSCCFAALARDSIVHKFLATDGELLVFIDTDIYFERPQFELLLSHNVDVVGGLYMSRTFNNGRFLVRPVDVLRDETMQQCEAVATGFMAVRRSALEKIAAAFPDMWYETDQGEKVHEYFPSGTQLVPHNWMSDDFSFCWLARKAGCEVWCDTRIKLGHIGNMIFGIK
jgi:hypothetical protein